MDDHTPRRGAGGAAADRAGGRALIAASFERLSKESRYRRSFTHKDTLDPDELAYLVDVDHQSHEAIIAVDPSNGEALGVTRCIRSEVDAQLAKVLRAAAAGSVVPAKTLAHRIADSVGSSPRASSELRSARTIVVGADGSETGEKALAVALELGGVLGAASDYGELSGGNSGATKRPDAPGQQGTRAR